MNRPSSTFSRLLVDRAIALAAKAYWANGTPEIEGWLEELVETLAAIPVADDPERPSATLGWFQDYTGVSG